MAIYFKNINYYFFIDDDIPAVIKTADFSYTAGDDFIHTSSWLCKGIFCTLPYHYLIGYCFGSNCNNPALVSEMEDH